VLAGGTPNALTFEGHGGKAVVGVTRGLLEADLSYAELEGVMAHQLAGVMVGDFLRRPGARGFEFSAYALLGLYSIVALAAAAMVGAGRGPGAGVGFLAAAAAVLFAAGFAIGKLRREKAHDYLLGDTIATAITRNPGALAGSIRKVDRMVNRSARMPYTDGEQGLKHLFVCPYRFSETAAQFVARRHRELNMKSSDTMVERQVAGMQEAMDKLAGWAEPLIAERLAALEAIEPAPGAGPERSGSNSLS
jgi:Zn-dependent protease with chaperone function